MIITPAGSDILDPEMKLINYDAPKMAELAGRTCYKSEDKITDTSYKDFMEMIVKRGHTSVLEHGGVYLKFTSSASPQLSSQLFRHRFTFMRSGQQQGRSYSFVYTNLRAIWELWPELYQCIMNRTELPKGVHLFTPAQDDPWRQLVVRFTVDRGVTHELVRQRDASFSQESTRYCNYSNGKFGSAITFVDPFFWAYDSEEYTIWKDVCMYCETGYKALIDLGAKPEEARSVLPNSTKSEIVMSTSLNGWKYIFSLRVPTSAHPQMREVMIPLYNEFIEHELILGDDITVSLEEKLHLLFPEVFDPNLHL